VGGAQGGEQRARRPHSDSDEDGFYQRLGRCFELAGTFMIHDPSARLLIHGTIQGDGRPALAHAWVYTRHGDIWEPITNSLYDPRDFKAMFSPVQERAYSLVETSRHMLVTKHYGPWHNTTGTTKGEVK